MIDVSEQLGIDDFLIKCSASLGRGTKYKVLMEERIVQMKIRQVKLF
jgi:hypothetical protein